MSDGRIGGTDPEIQERRWRAGAIAGALSVLIVALATLAGFAATAAHDAYFEVLQPGAHAPGDLEALSAARLGTYFFAFQAGVVLLTLLCARLLRGKVRGQPLALGWPRGGVVTLTLAVLTLLALATAAGLIIHRLDKSALASDLRPFAEMARSRAWWVLFLAAGVGAPLAEEMLFRGFLYSGLRATPLGFGGTAAVTALFWTSLHATYSPYGLILLLVIGLYFAWLRERSFSIWPSIAAHAVYNGLIVLALAFAQAEQLPGG